VEHAISSQPLPETLIARRKRCCEVLVKLCAALQDEWNAWLPRVHCDIRPIVGRRMVPFCREISLVTQFIDIPLWADYVCGLPMAGWACHSMALPPKLTAPSATVQSIAAVAPGHNSKIFASVQSTGDLKLDMASWVKSKKEFEVQTLKGPYKFADLPAGVRLLPRRPIWECHGGNVEDSCRNIDDCLVGEQNSSVGVTAVHRPATVDTLVAGGRRVSEQFPLDALAGFTSDFGGAYRQVAASPDQALLFGVTMWDAEACETVVGLAVAQLFGEKSAPLNFPRYPDWCAKSCSA